LTCTRASPVPTTSRKFHLPWEQLLVCPDRVRAWCYSPAGIAGLCATSKDWPHNAWDSDRRVGRGALPDMRSAQHCHPCGTGRNPGPHNTLKPPTPPAAQQTFSGKLLVVVVTET
jgi:hypothetical protein